MADDVIVADEQADDVTSERQCIANDRAKQLPVLHVEDTAPPCLQADNFVEAMKSLCKSCDGKQRLSWHQYFASMAILASARSPCERLHVGCVIVRENRILSMGYNGFFSGAPHKSIMKNGHEQATVHAEQNAISHAARVGISLNGAVAYITHYPCVNCFKSLVSAGIRHIHYLEDYRNDPVNLELSQLSRVKIDRLSD